MTRKHFFDTRQKGDIFIVAFSCLLRFVLFVCFWFCYKSVKSSCLILGYISQNVHIFCRFVRCLIIIYSNS